MSEEYFLDNDLWQVEMISDTIALLLAKNAVGKYRVPLKLLKFAVRALDPTEIYKVLDATKPTSCACRAGIGEARCQHGFNYEQVCAIRGEWYTSASPIEDAAARLKQMPSTKT